MNKTLLDMIRDDIGEEALVLWDQLEIEIDTAFRNGSAGSLWPLVSNYREDGSVGVKTVMIGGRFVAAWVYDHWIKREKPFEVEPNDTETFMKFTQLVNDEIAKRKNALRNIR